MVNFTANGWQSLASHAFPRPIRFGEFEADLVSGELRQDGLPGKILQDQPLAILRALVTHPGEMVSREELIQLLWNGNTNVDFDPSLNKAVNRLRESLGDSAETPRYIETLSRRGYRLIPKVEALEEVAAPGPPQSNWKIISASCVAAVLLAGAIASFHWKWSRLTPAMRQRVLTANGPENAVLNAYLSPNGKYLAYTDRSGVVVRNVETGESRPIANTRGNYVQGWFPDGDRLLVNGQMAEIKSDLWSVSLLTGVKRKLLERSRRAAVSPDGLRVAVITVDPNEIWLIGPSGEDPLRVMAERPKTEFFNLTWAPNSKRLAYEIGRDDDGGPPDSIETIDSSGGSPTIVLSKAFLANHINSGLCWLADGRLVYSQYEAPPNIDDGNVWAVSVDPVTGAVRGEPTRLTHSAGISLDTLSASSDGKRLSYRFGAEYLQAYVAELREQGRRVEAPRLLTNDHWMNVPTDWAPDSKSVLVVSLRRGRGWILRQSLLDSHAEELAANLAEATETEFSPDGEWVLYWSSTGGVSRILRMPIAGGAPVAVLSLPDRVSASFRCSSPGHLCVLSQVKEAHGADFVVFSSFDPVQGNPKQLLTLPLPPAVWALSPDGTRIAMVDQSNHIRIVHIADGATSILTVKKASSLWSLCWQPDGKSLVVTDIAPMVTMIRVDLSGRTDILLEIPAYIRQLRVSPDGRWISFTRLVHEGNAAILEDF